MRTPAHGSTTTKMRLQKMNLLRAAAGTASLPMLRPRRALPQPDVRIEAVALREPRPGELATRNPFPWRCDDHDLAPLLVLNSRMRLADLAATARALCVANRVLPRGTPEDTLRDLLEVPSLVLPGGLAFTVDGARAVTPGCCAGLEGWRSWPALLDSGASPWGGHDPFASATSSGRQVHVFADAGKEPRVVLEKGAYASLLLDVERDMLVFVRLFEGWVHETAPAVARAVAAKAARDLKIVG